MSPKLIEYDKTTKKIRYFSPKLKVNQNVLLQINFDMKKQKPNHKH